MSDALRYFNRVINEVEGLELCYKNYVEYFRIFCPNINHHNGKTENKKFYHEIREEYYIMKLEMEVKVLKWFIEELLRREKFNKSFYGS